MKKEKPQLHPLRKMVIRIGLPLYLLLSCVVGIGSILLDVALGAADKPSWITFAGIGVFVLATVAILAISAKVTEVEIKAEKQRFSFLFEEPILLENDQVQFEEAEVFYTLTQDGLRIKLPKGGEQVFDEVKEDEVFLSWQDADLAFATRCINRRIDLALAVLPNDGIMSGGLLFLSLTKEIFAAIKHFELGDKIGGNWMYLLYNPDDAFKQIFKKGRIIVMRNKKTGKIFVDKHGDFFGGDE